MAEIKVIKQSFEILDQNLPMTKKVGKMARICYRSEASASDEADTRLIKNCINEGHTSVIEHGMMSVYLGRSQIDPKVFNDPGIKSAVSTIAIWNQFHSPEIAKYIEHYADDCIYKIIDGANATPHPYPVLLANFRAWHNILDQCMVAATEQGFPLGIAFIAGIIVKAAKEFPSVFGDLVDKTNEAFSKAPADHFLCKLFKPEGADILSINHLSKYYDNFEIACSPATPRASMSVILRTNRAVTHQLVRHRRDVAYSQESQRYCNYMNKGYEVIWPSVDPVKFNGATVLGVDGKQIPFNDDGTFNECTEFYAKWLKSMQRAAEDYEVSKNIEILLPVAEGETDDKKTTVPAETARGVLPNDFATTIGVTWTPATFANLMFWRLDTHAQWQIRQLLGDIVIDGLKKYHEFFENFPPRMIVDWINKIAEQHPDLDKETVKDLLAYQDKRQQNINMQMAAFNKRIEEERKAAEEAAKKKEAEKDEPKVAPKMGEPVGPESETK